jgi:transposase
MQTLFYDLSSTTFSGSRCVLVNWGHCKEGYENHIVLALIVNPKGLPIYWEVLEGGTADATTISWLLSRLQEKLPCIPVMPTMVFDRGMVSDDNLLLLEEAGVKYISAMDKNQLEEITGVDFMSFADMTEETVTMGMDKRPDFMRLDNNTYCKEVCVKGSRRYVLCFNAQLFKDQRKAREEQLTELASFVEDENRELLQAKKDRGKTATQEKFNTWLRRAKLHGFVEVALEEKYVPKRTKRMLKAVLSYQGRAHIDQKKKLASGKLDGFWLLVTNHSEKTGDRYIHDTSAVVQPYREKVVIESSFRDIKSFIEVSPVHVWKEEHVRAHYTICVLGHLLDRTLSLALHAKHGSMTQEVVSHERLYEELAGCRLNHLKVGSKQNLYKLTEPTQRQIELLDRLDMRSLVEDATISALTAGKCGDYV